MFQTGVNYFFHAVEFCPLEIAHIVETGVDRVETLVDASLEGVNSGNEVAIQKHVEAQRDSKVENNWNADHEIELRVCHLNHTIPDRGKPADKAARISRGRLLIAEIRSSP